MADEQTKSPVLITGGGRRLGRHAAEALADSDQPVIITYRTERPELDLLRNKGIVTLQADFSDQTGILDFIERLKAETPSLRAIIHNASDWLPDEKGVDNASLAQTADGFQHLFSVHMLAPLLINQACELLLLAHQGPRDIIHLSDAVVRKGSKKHGTYVASKAGLESLTQSFAARFAPDIKVNAIAPALIMFQPDDDAEYRKKALKKSALQIEPGAEVITQTIRYILDNPYLTGVILPVEGGRSVV
ncbi:MAG: dihydromonapterin reductase [Oceanospirillum sp.]|nr:dihydromonapterin reductase [Oceanospirillum sp.]